MGDGQRFESSWARRFFLMKQGQRTDKHFMRLAIAEAEKAAALGETPVGAVLTINS